MSDHQNPILVVEDDKYLSKIIVNRLLDEGFSVQSADDGAQALLMVKGGRFSLILLDLLMPVMDGFDFLRKLRESDARTPVMVFSNLEESQKKEETEKLGANSYYVKSDISIDEIVEKIKELLNKKTA